MNIRLVGVLSIAVGCVLACDRAETTPFNADEHLAAWVELWRTYDLAGVDELFLKDSRTTYLSSEREGLIRGISDIRAHHIGFGFVDGGTSPDQELWVENVAGNVFGSTAVVTARWFFGDRNADRDSVQQGPMTAVYVVHDGRHKIAHMHFANY